MVQSVVIIGAVMAAVLVLIGIVLTKAAGKAKYLPYYPAMVIFGTGIILVTIPTVIGKVTIMGAGLGGWGIAFLFASAIGFIITSIVDSFQGATA
ncbi:hypothetical protein ACFFIS_17120 [Virgibacillus soli]|uniref:Uncharacterized protein n=1 Tax=Paracerasibacillus soli TaxID=480284 RepID=A0ABU5CUE0_9BACI|nr:hypothetical protein [Virgibacillus soli]MDY0409043.1 hypothetical protein [Virgibacillus soli]